MASGIFSVEWTDLPDVPRIDWPHGLINFWKVIDGADAWELRFACEESDEPGPNEFPLGRTFASARMKILNGDVITRGPVTVLEPITVPTGDLIVLRGMGLYVDAGAEPPP